ncbi:MAG: helix-turn-helix domain-containing protein [Kiritimatiellae bacterium]|nr:helix-turn-helix domain-containing protein [Kiritimatiellia bacterium]
MAHSNVVQSLVRGLDILALIARSETGIRVYEAAASLGVKAPTAHNLLRSLLSRGFVARRAPAYILGPALFEMLSQWQRRECLRQAEKIIMAFSRQWPSATLTYTEPAGSELMVRLRLSPERPGHLERPLDRKMSWFASVSGLVAQAYADEPQRQAVGIHYPFDEYGASQWKSAARLNQELAAIRCQGYGVYPFHPEKGVRVALPVIARDKIFYGCYGVRMDCAASRQRALVREIVAGLKKWARNGPETPRGSTKESLSC